MDEIVVEYRGVSGELTPGEALTVESCEAGVLRLRRAPASAPAVAAPLELSDTDAKGNADA